MKKITIRLFVAITCAAAIFLSSCEADSIDPISSKNDMQDQQKYSDEELIDILDEENQLIHDPAEKYIVDLGGMDVSKENPKKVYVHYMPWFQSKDYDGYWGQHWTMTNRNPEVITEDGKRQIASYFYPLIGPYSSSDPDLHEYHFLMMKLAGVDGVIFDWYGSRDQYDYGLIKQATETFIDKIEDLGLQFSIMYEDRVATQAVEQGFHSDKITAAQEDFLYIRNEYFSSPNYIKYNNNHLLFVFGPQHITTEEEWEQIFEVLPQEEHPDFLTLWASSPNVGNYATGEFLWVAQDHLVAHEHYYNTYVGGNDITVGSSYPGFNSFYAKGGWTAGINTWTIENGPDTFVETLHFTHHEAADFIQLITWNDFGEGTMIEPTEEFGFTYLQLLQQYTGVSHTPEDLQVAMDLYQTRKKYKNDTEAQLYLDRTYQYIKQLKLKRADKIISAVNRFF